ncbi:MAG: biopolymer transporter ExbD [Bdellovibrionales bacterium]|nr:biopolymer transporter ExbD [Bdellovibrionales bacterium]
MAHKSRKKHLEFELYLVPFIDLLSVCICFLLITAVWIQIGSLNVKQAIGGQAASDSVKKATLWVRLGAGGQVHLETKDSTVPKKLASVNVAGIDGKPNSEQVQTIVSELRAKDQTLATALIQPDVGSVYEDIVQLMDHVKKAGIVSLGLTPL